VAPGGWGPGVASQPMLALHSVHSHRRTARRSGLGTSGEAPEGSLPHSRVVQGTSDRRAPISCQGLPARRVRYCGPIPLGARARTLHLRVGPPGSRHRCGARVASQTRADVPGPCSSHTLRPSWPFSEECLPAICALVNRRQGTPSAQPQTPEPKNPRTPARSSKGRIRLAHQVIRSIRAGTVAPPPRCWTRTGPVIYIPTYPTSSRFAVLFSANRTTHPSKPLD